MNKQRRKQLEKAHELITEAMEIIESVCAEEQEAFENMPVSLQGSERGEQMSDYIDTLSEHPHTLEDVTLELEEIING